MKNAKSSATRGGGRKKTGRGSPVIRGASSWGTNSCSTGKRSWQSRTDAKAYARMLGRQGKPGMNAFRCDECRLFHIGHLPNAVRAGEIGRNDYYGAEA